MRLTPELKAAVTQASSEILKTVMEAMTDPEGGIGIDQVEALILGHIEPVLESEHRAALEPGPCGHPKMFWKPELCRVPECPIKDHGHCALCFEVSQAEESMRQRAADATYKKSSDGLSSMWLSPSAAREAILALPLSSRVK